MSRKNHRIDRSRFRRETLRDEAAERAKNTKHENTRAHREGRCGVKHGEVESAEAAAQRDVPESVKREYQESCGS